MPTEPQGITWDPAPQPVQPGNRQGGVILTDPTVQAEEERKRRDQQLQEEANARAAAAAKRAAAKDALTIEEKERKLAGGAAAQASEGERKSAAFLTRAVGANDTYNSLDIGPRSYAGEVAYDAAPGILNQLPSSVGNSPERQQADAAQLEFIAAVLRSDSGAAIPENEIETARKLYFPVSGDSEEVIQQKAQARERAIEGLKNAAGRLAPDDMPSALDPSKAGATEPGITGQGGAFMTPRDKELQDRLRAAYSAGAPLEEMQAIAEEYGVPVGLPETQEALDAARAQGRQLNVNPSGFREEETSILGITPESAVGAFAMSAANALLSGGLDEIVGAMGGDADLAQAAKTAIRDKYPVSSFTGEVTGQVMQMAGVTKALGAAGMGAKGAAATAEIGGGAAYGAGEANENRLLGTVVGAGSAAGGRKLGDMISSRLSTPKAQSAIAKVAEDAGVPEAEVTRVLQELAQGVPPTATEQAAEPLTEAAQQEVATLARQAIGIGPRGRAARRKLARMAQVDPAAQAAADRLGVELPVDILSDNSQVQSLAGLARSQVGSDAETAWRNVSARVSQQADQALGDLGASADLAQVSDDVLQRVNASMESLEAQAVKLREGVDAAINVRDRVEAGNLQNVLADLINDFGGLPEAKAAFSGEERKLLAMLGEGGEAIRPTYARLNALRDEIGRALFKGQGPWADTAQANLARYYGALADDQIAYIETKGGAELAEQMRASNSLFSQMFDTRRDMQTLFGKQLEGSLTPLLNRALRQGSKGDARAINQLLERVPEDMQGPVLLSAIMGQARSSAAHGGFSFPNFTKLYRGLRDNGPIYAKIAKAVGPEGERILADLYSVSRRMADGETKVLKTGKANQALISAMQAQGLVGGVLEATARRTVTAGSAAAGGAMGGPTGAFVGAAIAENAQSAISRGGKSRLDKAHDLLSSAEFRGLVDKLATGENTTGAINRLLNSRGFNRFASMIGLSTPEAKREWITRSLAAGASAASASTMSPEVSTVAIEVSE